MSNSEKFSVSTRLQDNYENYYQNGESEWRLLGALDKVDNIIGLFSNYPHATVLEIGSGDGSILQRLSDMGFAESFYSLEISSSAVETIRQRGIQSLVECSLFDGYKLPYREGAFLDVSYRVGLHEIAITRLNLSAQPGNEVENRHEE